MKYRGHRFTRSVKVVQMKADLFTAEELQDAGYTRERQGSYVIFGRTCSPDEPGAKETHYTWEGHSYKHDWVREGSPVYAKIVPCDGYSQTNMMYGADGYVYLMHDGAFYVRGYSPRKERYLRLERMSEDEASRCRMAYNMGNMYRVLGRHRSEEAAKSAATEDQYVVSLNLPLGGTEIDRVTCQNMPKKGDYVSQNYLDPEADNG